MYKAYKFRLYPNDSQRVLIHKTFGCVRFVYNYFLDKCKKNGYIKAYDMCKELKKLQYKRLRTLIYCFLSLFLLKAHVILLPYYQDIHLQFYQLLNVH